ncbi:FkbM family methyltransferase [Butyrivibrio sp. AE3006]|uniref:FkbM family methyltransferase n=1 Tax=Butyrivibrio sp. AE3006 TaxID=1280673 RepID=UPI00047E2532|nr:FkbM family methyltransferase [Butyrivibrio sp. AE3006]
MRYITSTKIEDIRDRYDLIIGWGNSNFHYERFYNPSMYKIDYIINGLNRDIGKVICGNQIFGTDKVSEIKDEQRLLIIIYSNIEDVVMGQLEEYLKGKQYDTIVSRLICSGTHPKGFTYSSDGEDVIVLDLLNKMGISNPRYMDIGVCHPVASNNTFLFYDNGFSGVLVEPNPSMAGLAKAYRSRDVIENVGVTAGADGKLQYVMRKVHPGINHILREGEKIDERLDKIIDIDTININKLLEKNKCEELDYLDIDIEGMDYDVINSVDFHKFKIKVICAEYKGWGENRDFRAMMQTHGYVHYMTTMENHIYLREDLLQLVSE